MTENEKKGKTFTHPVVLPVPSSDAAQSSLPLCLLAAVDLHLTVRENAIDLFYFFPQHLRLHLFYYFGSHPPRTKPGQLVVALPNRAQRCSL